MKNTSKGVPAGNTKIESKAKKIERIFANTILGMELFKDNFLNSLLFHIPHASTDIPAEFLGDYLVDHATLRNEIDLVTDHAVNKIFDFAPSHSKVVFEHSRVFCDVERLADKDEDLFKLGRGFYYTKTDSGFDFRKETSKAIIYENYYLKYHRQFEESVSNIIAREGFVHIIDCHSFNDSPLNSDLDKNVPRPDFCIGTVDGYTPEWMSISLKNYLSDMGYTVKINTPYSGSIIPQGMTDAGRISSIMIEVNKKLYMDKNVVLKTRIKELHEVFRAFFFEKLVSPV